MTPQERRRRLEAIERRLGIGRGASRIYLCDTDGDWLGDPPPDGGSEPDEVTIIAVDFVEPPAAPAEARTPHPQGAPH